MKRLILVLLLFTSINAFADKFNANAYKYAVKYTGQEWSDWHSCIVPIYIDTDNCFITIGTVPAQKYVAYQATEPFYDEQGGYTVKLRVIDQDNDLGMLHLRIDPENVAQLYIEFANVVYVYSDIRLWEQ